MILGMILQAGAPKLWQLSGKAGGHMTDYEPWYTTRVDYGGK